jgi:hypothetical protein
MDKKSYQRWAPLVTVLLLLGALFLLKQCGWDDKAGNKAKTEETDQGKQIRGLNRSPDKIHYSKHAQCRMECRKIDADEVLEILKTGKINYAKSEIGNQPDCRRKYAVEGTTKRDKQRVRIIFAPCGNEVTVVTVIDIGRDWPCDCK